MVVQAGTFRGFDIGLRDPGIAVITFNQPERLNGQTREIKRELIHTLLEIQYDDAVRVVVITGAGRAFSAGDDITDRTPNYGDAPVRVPDVDVGERGPIKSYGSLRSISQEVNLAIRRLDKLTIAAINGVAIQSGLSIALACDFRIASDTARLGSATLRFGYQPDEGGHWLLVQIIGVANTMDFLMRKRIVTAEEALALGLVHEVAPSGELMDRSLALARELAEGPQVAMRLLKRAVYNAAEMTLLQADDDIASKTAISDHHSDAREGRLAFNERRTARFNKE